jgi:UPF0755 protein
LATKKKMRQPLLIIFLVFVILGTVLVLGFFGLNNVVKDTFGEPVANLGLTQQIIYPLELFFNRDNLTSSRSQTSEELNFEIGEGESVSMVCLRLEKQGLIDDAELFRIYLIYTGRDRFLQSGQFKLDASSSPVQLSEALMQTNPTEAVVTILPGWRIEEVGANIAASGLTATGEDFISIAYTPADNLLSLLPGEGITSLEGFLFPGSYTFPRETNLEQVINTILVEFSTQLDNSLIEGFTRQGLSIYEGIILASIIEKEAVVDDEKPMIASVFYNRLAQGFRLETDPTVQYALGYQVDSGTWWKSPLSLDDLSIESSYNTYKNIGLPPTPICNPDLDSLRAAAFPAESPYLYFRAACDGSGRHNFAITFEEHLENACD